VASGGKAVHYKSLSVKCGVVKVLGVDGKPGGASWPARGRRYWRTAHGPGRARRPYIS
jgi:hypothetical protein